MDNLKAILEALIFAADAPLPADRIREVLTEVTPAEIREALEDLQRDYGQRQGGLCLEVVAGGFQFRTRPELGPWIKRMKGNKPLTLTPAAMETLAVVAYRQPVVKLDVDRVRGVDSGGSLKRLLERKLIRILGRKDVPGKPILYGTTRKFLEIYHLNDLSELPTMRELSDLQE